MPAEQIALAQETSEDFWDVEALYDLTFAPGRTALSSYRLRDDVDPIASLCLVARDGAGILAGAVRNWPVQIGPARAILLGPIAVHPTRQGEGIAALLMWRALELARDQGWDRVLLVGDAPYYGRFGFDQLTGVRMPPPTNPARVLGAALTPGAWDGIAGTVTRVGD
ncbi:GNAT family N-acetyltransferase [Yoonia sp. R2331]|uniref:GNAT family N-acetyltransferase n=1 Tax=Yoonia sp. R2331 TaxID=3237238 RepID=UPI0034E58C65